MYIPDNIVYRSVQYWKLELPLAAYLCQSRAASQSVYASHLILCRLSPDSLGGNARTIMVANMGPAAYNYDESVTTLRYANRAKNIKNKPKINEDPKDALLREFQEEIGKLKVGPPAALAWSILR